MFLPHQLYFSKTAGKIPLPFQVVQAQDDVTKALEKLQKILEKNKREVKLPFNISEYHLNIAYAMEIIYKPEILDELNEKIRFAKADISTLIKMINDHGQLVDPAIYARDWGGIFGDSKEEFLQFIYELNDLRKLTENVIDKVKFDIKNPHLQFKQDLCQKTLSSLRKVSRDLQKIRQEIKPISKALWDIQDTFMILDDDFYKKHIK